MPVLEVPIDQSEVPSTVPTASNAPDLILAKLPPNLDQTIALRALRLKVAGVPYAVIARNCGRALQTVKNWFTTDGELKPAYDAAIECAAEAVLGDREAIQQRFLTEANRSTEVVCEVRDDYKEAKPSDRLAASKDILDRAGFKPIDKSMVATAHVGTEQLDETFDALMAGVEQDTPTPAPASNKGSEQAKATQPTPTPPHTENEASIGAQGGGGVRGSAVAITHASPPPSPHIAKGTDNGEHAYALPKPRRIA